LAKARRVVGRMNGLEANYAANFLAHKPHFFEAVTLKLAHDTRYTPDFMVMESDGTITFIECKGFWREDAKVKIKVAAEMYPMFRFRAVRYSKKMWHVERFGLEDVA
jgi:hypothetical protein